MGVSKTLKKAAGVATGGALIPALSGTAALAGDLAGGYLNYKSQKKANKQNRELTREQMKFQTEANQKQMDFAERMSNTAHQRQVEDLKKAGLNPILAAGGTGASAPQGSTSAGANTTMLAENGLASAISNMAPRSIEAAQGIQNLKLTEAQINNVKANTRLTDHKSTTQDNINKLSGPMADLANNNKEITPWVQLLGAGIGLGAFGPAVKVGQFISGKAKSGWPAVKNALNNVLSKLQKSTPRKVNPIPNGQKGKDDFVEGIVKSWKRDGVDSDDILDLEVKQLEKVGIKALGKPIPGDRKIIGAQ